MIHKNEGAFILYHYLTILKSEPYIKNYVKLRSIIWDDIAMRCGRGEKLFGS